MFNVIVKASVAFCLVASTVKAQNCPEPDVADAYVWEGEFTPGSIRQVDCGEDFVANRTLNSTFFITCQTTGTWLVEQFCVRAGRPAPQVVIEPPAGRVVDVQLPLGGVVGVMTTRRRRTTRPPVAVTEVYEYSDYVDVTRPPIRLPAVVTQAPVVVVPAPVVVAPAPVVVAPAPVLIAPAPRVIAVAPAQDTFSYPEVGVTAPKIVRTVAPGTTVVYTEQQHHILYWVLIPVIAFLVILVIIVVSVVTGCCGACNGNTA